jgi:hypothetical protein
MKLPALPSTSGKRFVLYILCSLPGTTDGSGRPNPAAVWPPPRVLAARIRPLFGCLRSDVLCPRLTCQAANLGFHWSRTRNNSWKRGSRWCSQVPQAERPSPRTAAAVRPAGALLLPLSEDLRRGTGGPALVRKPCVEMLLLLLLSVCWFDAVVVGSRRQQSSYARVTTFVGFMLMPLRRAGTSDQYVLINLDIRQCIIL